ncbi:helix-turn-helix domain-containing protein [Paraglaciecola chathamensis]|uniref:helix-turn-helix domain-containing protein n=1 Tax=Paraglaciecola chathamensis TaxID=368405 RepID=UPI0027023104|nr:helix-turn-helix transcriptional regulator [Paraglaciecola chathamensis]MDO6561383.1 helix-turn-helix transcriptional regulator [Paraglaciecola chathamensis]
MKVQIDNATEFGSIVKSVRQAQGIDQRDMASILSVSVNPVKALESGKGTVALQTALNALNELGVKVVLELPLDMDTKHVEKLLSRKIFE